MKAEQGNVWLALVIMLAAAVIPLYLSMFRMVIGGVNFRLADIFSIAVISLSFLLIPAIRGQALNIRMVILYGLSIYMLFQSIIYANTFAGIKEIIQLLFVGFFIVMNNWVISINRDRYLQYFIYFLVLSASVTVLYHFATGNLYRYKNAGDGKYVFGLLSVVLFLSWVHSKKTKYVYYFMLSLPILLLSLERKGLFGLILVVFAFLAVNVIHYLKLKVSHLIVLFVIVAFILLLFNGSDIGRYYLDKVYFDLSVDEVDALYISNVHRESLIINGIQIFLNNMYFGVGADNIYREMEAFYTDFRLANVTHNFYLDNLIKLGVFGFLFLAALAVVAINSAKSKASYLFILYLLFVSSFMSDGQSVLLLFLFSTSAGALFPAVDDKKGTAFS
jgi:O-antigen ligase